ncbi:interferon gamma receptor 1-like isoform X2 [Osmerus mordax]|uniref:interferon gamma receptor 1-like isoform X2 n=1 Tax=Osmerus mordax TaxID=8014 RepID=UPI00350F799D
MNVSIFLVIYFILIKQNLASYVLPVENVTIVCHNLQTVVYWNHSQPELQPRFTVTLQSYYEGMRTQVCTDTPAYYCNVSAATQENIGDDYIVYVNVSGQNESQRASDTTFSYDRRSSSNQICSVDLPSVNIAVQPDHHVKVYFPHPFHIYKEAIKLSDRNTKFDYVIITKDQKKHDLFCYSEDNECEAWLPAEMAADKHCVNIKGFMDALTVTTPELICIDEPPPTKDASLTILYILLPVIIILAVCCALYLVFRKWTKIPLPESITKMLKGVNGYPLLVEATNISPVIEDPTGLSSDGCSRLLFVETPTTDLHPAHSDPGSSGQQTHFRFPIPRPTQEVTDEDVTALPRDESSLQGEVEEVEEAQLDNREDLQAGSGYERRDNIIVEMDAGDIVEAYK